MKEKIRKIGKEIKQKAKAYGAEMEKAYLRGYQKGFEDFAEKKVFGSSVAGAIGYLGGAKGRKKYEKVQSKLNKQQVIQNEIHT